MKKTVSILLSMIFCMAALFTGCAAKIPTADDSKLNVVATIFPQYDFTRAIAGDKVNLSLLIPPGGESHTYEPTPQDIICIQNADVFIYVGGENDTWLDGILDNLDTGDMTVISLLDCVQTLEEELVEGMQAPGAHNHGSEEQGQEAFHEAEPDEHVWTSPVNALAIARQIEQVLCEKDSANADFYRANMEAYKSELLRLHGEFRALVDTIEKKELIFGDRFPLRYFAEEYGFTYYAAFPGCSAESEPSAKTIAFLIDKVKADAVGTVFYIEFSNHLAADTIAGEAGVKTALFHSCHNVTADEMEAGVTYLSLMQQNLDTLKAAFFA